MKPSTFLCLVLTTLICSFALAAEPRNVILIIGDGMDDQQITIARNYLQGATGKLTLDTMAHRSSVQVLTVENDDPAKYVYVADSASSGTAMATGQVTSRGRISTRPGSDEDIRTIAELAHAAGFKTGLVSTSSVTDATPSAFGAHISFRFCENPSTMVTERGSCYADLKANGGHGSISEQLSTSSLDVILGGGMKHFAVMDEEGSSTVLDIAHRSGFHLVSTTEELGKAPRDKKLLGLFADSHLAVRLQGEKGRIAEEPEVSLLSRLHRSLGSVTLPEPMTCEPNPEAAGTPSLVSLAEAAVKHLGHENGRGFFLMVESASIDKQAHARNPCGSIGELEQLDEVVAYALAFANENPDTLVIVTSDHSQAAQLIPEQSLFSTFGFSAFSAFTPGKLARIVTPEGSIMGVNYATSNFFLEEHTGATVPLYANEPAAGRLPVHILQTDVFRLAKAHLGL